MRVLVIGGTSFIGPYLVDNLMSAGHEVSVFHRGQTDNLRARPREILGDRSKIDESADMLLAVSPDVIVDMIPHSRKDAEGVLRVFSGSEARIVGISSANLYRGFALFTRDAEGPVIPGPLTEESPLRERPVEGDDKRSMEQAHRPKGSVSFDHATADGLWPW